jgi:hypothetical protein
LKARYEKNLNLEKDSTLRLKGTNPYRFIAYRGSTHKTHAKTRRERHYAEAVRRFEKGALTSILTALSTHEHPNSSSDECVLPAFL